MNKVSAKLQFYRPFYSEEQIVNLKTLFLSENISSPGIFTQHCEEFLFKKFYFKNIFLTKSCTSGLEMAALLCNIGAGDEVIVPSYTFVSSANPFLLLGANIVFADSEVDSPNIDVTNLERLITYKTKAIVVMHYAGIACDMEKIMEIANRHKLIVIEDAAHCIASFYKKKPFGKIGHLSTFSFHTTKNITCGEGGMLLVNDKRFIDRAELIYEKGTNRRAFKRGEVKRYEWMDVGSSFALSEINATVLYSQLLHLDTIQKKRMQLYALYCNTLIELQTKGKIKLPFIPTYSEHNAHVFYIICSSENERELLMNFLQKQNIPSTFHYSCLHLSSYYKRIYAGKPLPNAEKYEKCLLRLPLHFYMEETDIEFICYKINKFYTS